MLRSREFDNRGSSLVRADGLAFLVLLGAGALATWLTWGLLYDPIVDQGWQMQASSRVSGGEVLYRDAIWMYGPLPVYLLAWLYRVLGISVTPFLLLYALLVVAGALLTYRVARFLLPPPLALLGTVALFLGGWWGGFVGYDQAYTGAVPLGAVLGLLFVLCLLSYLKDGQLGWLVGAGLSSGLALLTKPEFGLACAGTGLVILMAMVLFPQGVVAGRGRHPQALAVYVLSAAAVAGLGYGLLAVQAGWDNIWLGITGYDQDAILLQVWPPWGTEESWLVVASGLGVYLLAATLIGVVSAPRAATKRPLALAGLVGAGLAGLALALLPWRRLARLNPSLISAMQAEGSVLIEQAIRVLWAPATLSLTVLLPTLAILWIRAHRQRQPLPSWAGYVAVLALYTALAAARSFFYPTGTFHFLYLDTFFPIFLFLAAELLPRSVERLWHTPRWVPGLQALLGLALVAYAAAGLVWTCEYYARLDTLWRAPRGTVHYYDGHERRQAWPELLDDILAHSDWGDPIAVLGQEPGFYFWSGRRNPLRQDTLLPGMESSAEDAQEIVRRFQVDPPRLIAIPQGVTYGRGWFWELEIGRQAYEDLAPVWDFIEANYEFRRVLGGQTWGYAVYEPRS
jgi:hypothetical protein